MCVEFSKHWKPKSLIENLQISGPKQPKPPPRIEECKKKHITDDGRSPKLPR